MVYLVISVAFWVMEMIVWHPSFFRIFHEVWMWRHGHGRRFEWFRSGRNGAIWSARKEGGWPWPICMKCANCFFPETESKWLGKSRKAGKTKDIWFEQCPGWLFFTALLQRMGWSVHLLAWIWRAVIPGWVSYSNGAMTLIYDVFPLHFLRGQTLKIKDGLLKIVNIICSYWTSLYVG